VRITTWVSPHVTWLQGQYDRNCLHGWWHKSPRVNGLVGRDWQRVQKTTLVSACYHALSLRDSRRKFKRITTRVSPHVTWLQGKYDRNCLRGRWRKSSRVNGLVGRDWQRVQKTTLVSTFYHALSLRDSKRKFKRITTWVSPHVMWLQGEYDRNCLRGRWCKSPRVNGLVGRDWQRVQKTTLVSMCYHALSLRDSKRKFKWITTRVSPHVTWLQGQYDRDCGAADKSKALAPTYPQWGTQTYVVLDNLWD